MDQEFANLRAALAAQGDESHCSPKFQDELIAAAMESASYGNSFVEVGCYRGGMTAQLALVARRKLVRLHVVDIDPDYLAHAQHVTESLVGEGIAQFHLCDFPTFVRERSNGLIPALVFIDGDHRYEGVMADIRALYAMEPGPHLAAFHDYSLRYTTEEAADIRVDRAIHDAFGSDAPLRFIGTQALPGGLLATEPQANGHYHETGAFEGVLIECTTAPRPSL